MPEIQLKERDLCILTHVGRFGMTTRKVLATLPYCETINVVKSLLKRLAVSPRRRDESRKAYQARTATRYLQARPLGVRQLRYFRLTNTAARLLGLPDSRADELGSQALPTRYAILMHCCLRGATRLPLSRSEFHTHLEEWRKRLYPDLPPESVTALPFHHTYYVAKHQSRTRLVRMVLDLGADQANIAAKCREMVATLRDRSMFFARLVDRGHFGIVVLTGSTAKRDSIREQFASSPLDGVQVAFDVVEDLTSILVRDDD